MHAIDWAIIAVYIAGMIGLSVYLGRGQKDDKDYYLGGNDMKWWSIGISTMATQCSTNSLLGAPAFVALVAGGGLLWLQYELAVPFAMIFIMMFLLPFYRSQNIVSVYEYLEKRFDVKTRTLVSVIFQFTRAFGTGVTVYLLCLLLSTTLGVKFITAAVILGVVTIVYDMIGGMKAVVISDVIQMAILYVGLVVCLFSVVAACGGWEVVLENLKSNDRLYDWLAFRTPELSQQSQVIDLQHTGLGDGNAYNFWAMLAGGFFLYCAYYGCDQSQVQRELSTKSIDDTNLSLFLNGLVRFPLVLTYCFLGLGIAVFVHLHPEFLDQLTVVVRGQERFKPDLAVPQFVLSYLHVYPGLVGLIFVALFAAAMSSLDSTINSLSATTMKDIIERFWSIDERQSLLYSKFLTIFWGVVCVAFAFFVEEIAESVITAINKVGSLANGPILATFLLAILTSRANGIGTIVGILTGFASNLLLWIFCPQISWLWWNVFGCVVTFTVGYLVSLGFAPRDYEEIKALLWRNRASQIHTERNWRIYYAILAGYGVFLIFFCYHLGEWLQ